MPLQLKDPNGPWPEGGWSFSDPHTGMQFDDPLADLNMQVAKVIEHRRANPSIYPAGNPASFNPANVYIEIITQVGSRHPGIVEDSALVGVNKLPTLFAQPIIPATPRPGGQPCPKCGTNDWSPVYCKSCSGNRIQGYSCKSCGWTT